MSERRFTEDHEWIDLDGEIGTVGITDFAQEQLGEVVFVEVPDVGKTVSKGDETAVVESVKAASELYAPCAGEVVEANDALADTPDLVNSDPEGAAWFYKIKISDKAEFDALMDADAYKAHTEA
ncbi:glycine cleavage system protein GcvH [Nisaea sediminum]|uniref:glycine cleavage system protein GcvH n=1 Tax=Nisaea sediminum TaxID=2775867 RepID=UPI001868DDFC|nr:glycine cleavage system protein GcvH [Nisaea sediminum]